MYTDVQRDPPSNPCRKATPYIEFAWVQTQEVAVMTITGDEYVLTSVFIQFQTLQEKHG